MTGLGRSTESTISLTQMPILPGFGENAAEFGFGNASPMLQIVDVQLGRAPVSPCTRGVTSEKIAKEWIKTSETQFSVRKNFAGSNRRTLHILRSEAFVVCFIGYV